jgi:hypothetical protein
MEKNIKKRWIIGFIYLLIFFALGWFCFYLFKPKETCFDGIKNQNEEGVDCGGVCAKSCKKIEAQNLTVENFGVLDASVSGEYDFFGVVLNPNKLYGSKYFDYLIKFEDENGAVIGEKKGNSFILPGEKKYIIENNVPLDKSPAKAELSISGYQWVEFQDIYESPNIQIVKKTYAEITSGVGFSEAKGLLENTSPYDFTTIKINIILKDISGKVLAVNSTRMNTVMSGENRDFRVFWPARFSGDVAIMEAQFEVNVFDPDSFTKKYIKGQQQFQNY